MQSIWNWLSQPTNIDRLAAAITVLAAYFARPAIQSLICPAKRSNCGMRSEQGFPLDIPADCPLRYHPADATTSAPPRHIAPADALQVQPADAARQVTATRPRRH